MQLPQEVLTSQETKSVVAKSEALQLKLKDLNQKIQVLRGHGLSSTRDGGDYAQNSPGSERKNETALQHQINGELTESMLVRSSFDAWKRNLLRVWGELSRSKKFLAGGAKMALKLTGEAEGPSHQAKAPQTDGILNRAESSWILRKSGTR